MVKKLCHEVRAAHLTGQEHFYHLPLDFDYMTSSQRKACDERSTQEIIEEDGFDTISQWSQIYNQFQ